MQIASNNNNWKKTREMEDKPQFLFISSICSPFTENESNSGRFGFIQACSKRANFVADALSKFQSLAQDIGKRLGTILFQLNRIKLGCNSLARTSFCNFYV